MKSIINLSQFSDTALWNLLIQGDQIALKAIYQKYYALLLNYALKYTSDKELIKDCIHDLFVHLYKNRNISVDTVSVRAYLIKSLRNSLINKLVTQQREIESIDNLSFNIPSDDNLFEQMFPKDDKDVLLARYLREAIEQLPEHQKEVLYLRYIKDLSHKEIAAVMHMNVQSSMNLTNRAIQKLREILAKKGFLVSAYYILVLLKYI